MKRPVWLLMPGIWLLAASTLLAQASSEILKAVPDNALGLVVVNRLAATTGKIEKLGLRVHQPVPDLLSLVKTISGVGTGLDEAGTVAVALFPGSGADKQPVPIIFVPVSNFGKFLGPLNPDDPAAEIIKVTMAGKPSLATQKGKFAVFARPEDEDVLRSVKKSAAGLEKLAEPLGKWLLANDAAVLLLPAGIQLASDGMQAGLAQAQMGLQAAGAKDAEQLKPALAMFESMQQIAQDAKEEVTQAGIGILIDDRGTLSMTARAAFLADGSLAKSVAKTEWPDQNPLAILPAGQFAFASGLKLPTSWVNGFLEFGLRALKAGGKDGQQMTDEQVEKLRSDTRVILAHFKPGMNGGMVGIAPADGEPEGLFQSLAGAFFVDDSAKYVADYQKSMESYNELSKQLDQPNLPTYDTKPIEVAGMRGIQVSFDIIKMLQQQQPDNPAAPMIEKLFGAGPVMVYIVAVNERTIGMAYGNKALLERIKEAIQNPSSSLANDSTVTETTGLLPEAAQYVTYISPAGMTRFVNVIAKAVSGEFTIPPFAETPPVGMGLKVSPSGLDARFVVPSPVIDALGDYLIKVKQMQQQQAP